MRLQNVNTEGRYHLRQYSALGETATLLSSDDLGIVQNERARRLGSPFVKNLFIYDTKDEVLMSLLRCTVFVPTETWPYVARCPRVAPTLDDEGNPSCPDHGGRK